MKIRKKFSEIKVEDLSAAYAAGFEASVDGDLKEVILWK